MRSNGIMAVPILVLPVCAHFTENKLFALSELKTEFHANVDGLREYMGGVLSTPHKVGDCNIVGGVTLQPLMTLLCEAASGSNLVKPRRCPTEEWCLFFSTQK